MIMLSLDDIHGLLTEYLRDYGIRPEKMYSKLSLTPVVSWEIVRDNPDKDWSWYSLSKKLNTTWEIVRDNPDKEWDWYSISKNPNIMWEIVRDNPEKDWNWFFLSENPNMTWEIVRR